MKQRSNKIDYLKGLSAILVVIGHAFYYVLDSSISGTGYLNAIGCSIWCIHVPMFIFLSGYLCHKQKINLFYKKKFFRIIIPFLVFTLLKLLFSIFIAKEFSHGQGFMDYYINLLFAEHTIGSVIPFF